MYQPLEEIRKKDMIDKLHDEESSEEENIYNWASARPPEIPELIPVEKLSEKESPMSEIFPNTESEKETPISETPPKTDTSETEEEGTSKKTSSEEGEEDEED
ncbi:uncharacterized protein LOC120314373 isoform X2 [Crotalus tigris]|uniref:uncharacterized protein LOC120314373 isoform X2 n=1 Tax=Crotalus tigris TaxID=88082 RepID=UPI00192FB50A|nr:uncharacterized protein LOC120314373 isoform X2 [Crotalus tigris]